MIPNLQHIVEQCKTQNPEAWKNAHTGNAHTEDFIRLCAPMLKAEDSRFGLNGKRGNPDDISDDAVNCLCDASDSAGRTPDGKPCVVIDVIIGAGGPTPSVGWGVFTTKPEADGANVDPSSTPIPPTPVPPSTVLPKPQAFELLKQLNAYYAAPEGLQRVMTGTFSGIIINGSADMEAIAQWFYQMVIEGVSFEQVKQQIRHSDEWKAKHPGETP